MSQGKDRTIFTITSAHDPNSDPVPFGNPSLTFREVRFRRNYRMRYPLSLPVLQTQNVPDSASSTDVSNTSTRGLNRSTSIVDSNNSQSLADSAATNSSSSSASSAGSSSTVSTSLASSVTSSAASGPAENPSGLSAGTEVVNSSQAPGSQQTTVAISAVGTTTNATATSSTANEQISPLMWDVPSDSEESDWSTDSDSTYVTTSDSTNSSQRSSSTVSSSSDQSQSFLRCSRLRRDYMRFFRGSRQN